MIKESAIGWFLIGMGVMGFCARIVPAPTVTLTLLIFAGAAFLLSAKIYRSLIDNPTDKTQGGVSDQ